MILFTVQEINSHLIMVFQLVVSVATAFVFGYMAPYFFYGMNNAGTRYSGCPKTGRLKTRNVQNLETWESRFHSIFSDQKLNAKN